jgi:hypothetical protein
MTFLKALTAALAISPWFAGVASHAGGHSDEEIKAEITLRNEVIASSRRALAKCSNSAASLALKERALARRAATAQALREKRGLDDSKTPPIFKTSQMTMAPNKRAQNACASAATQPRLSSG